MKKLIMILLAAVAFSCGGGGNESSESGEIQTEDNYSNDALESDTTQMMDTTAAPGMDREGQVDTTANTNNP